MDCAHEHDVNCMHRRAFDLDGPCPSRPVVAAFRAWRNVHRVGIVVQVTGQSGLGVIGPGMTLP